MLAYFSQPGTFAMPNQRIVSNEQLAATQTLAGPTSSSHQSENRASPGFQQVIHLPNPADPLEDPHFIRTEAKAS